MKTPKSYVKVIATTVALSLIAIVFTAYGRNDEANERASFHWSGLFGLTNGEAASLNYTNLSRRPAEARLSFYDANGNLLKQSTARLESGQSAVLILPYIDLGRVGRVQIRGSVRLSTPPEPVRGVGAVEVFDTASGKTSFGLLLPAAERGFDPQPDALDQE